MFVLAQECYQLKEMAFLLVQQYKEDLSKKSNFLIFESDKSTIWQLLKHIDCHKHLPNMYRRPISILFRRCINTKQTNLTQQVSQRIIIPAQANCYKKTPNTEKKFVEFSEEINSIEKYYNELEQFRVNHLLKKMGRNYSNFSDNPNELIFELDEFIELEIIARYSRPTKDEKFKHHIPSINVYCSSLSDKLLIERYLEFDIALKSVLSLNGSDTTIFDILLNAKAVFDKFERRKNRYE